MNFKVIALILVALMGTAWHDAPPEAEHYTWAMLGQDLQELRVSIHQAELAVSGTHQQEMREKTCRFQWMDKGTWTAREERRTALCIEARWPSPGGYSTLNRVIGCESGWYRLSYNPAGPYVGLGQHSLSSWSSRVRTYSPPLWHLSPGWANSRTMLTVTIRMMHSVGLGPWSCA